MSAERKSTITKRGATALAGTALMLGGAGAGIIGGNRVSNEYAQDNQAKGAITRGLELDGLGRPTPQELEEAKTFVRDLVSGVDQSSSTKDLYAISGRIIVNEDELNSHYGTLSREQNFQDVREIFMKGLGADDLDDANIWTLAAGSAATLAGVGILGSTLGSRNKQREAQSIHEEE